MTTLSKMIRNLETDLVRMDTAKNHQRAAQLQLALTTWPIG
jgi:hypothetical protein